MEKKSNRYTCSDYRLERYLLSLKMRLKDDKLSKEEREEIEKEVKRVEQEIGL